MLGTFQGLSGALEGVPLGVQQPPNGGGADRVAGPAEGVGKLAQALGGPAQRRAGIAAGVGVDQGIQGIQQPRVGDGQGLGTAARRAGAASRVGRQGQLALATGDRGAGAVGHLGDAGHAAVPQDQRERAVQQAALALGEVGAN